MNLKRIRAVLECCMVSDPPARPKLIKERTGFSEWSVFNILDKCQKMGLIVKRGKRSKVAYRTTDLGYGVIEAIKRTFEKQ